MSSKSLKKFQLNVTITLERLYLRGIIMSYIKHKSEESLEDYLETILLLSQKNHSVRSIDIVNELEYTKPSVSIAMKKLREMNLIVMDDNNYITLTKEGQDRAEKVLERHTMITELLVSIGVASDIAAEDACRIEHDISEETFDSIKKYVNSIKK